MRSQNEHNNGLEDPSYRELRLLEEVDQAADLSQRQLARRLGVALGVANLLVKSLASRGYIKVTHLSWKRWVYVVTPKGMARKLNLTLSYVDRFFQHYRRVRVLIQKEISELPLNRESRVAIVGTSDMSELTYLALKDVGVDEIDIFEEQPSDVNFLGMQVRRLDSIEPGEYAKVVITDQRNVGNDVHVLLKSFGVNPTQLVELLQTQDSNSVAENREGGSVS